ncbi:MAG: dihydrofolate synthase / folylpolyglutamate synthase [Thermotogota bacterium]|nr:dihydrofolate synthase / folylpolyglutamate synthase [Thermotogota bacterium]
MDYEATLNYLYGKLGFKKIRLGLERIQRLSELLGNPQHSYRVIHVAGTNGKGSVCAFLTSILSKTGLKVGTYISPHLWSFRERFSINGLPVSKEKIVEVLSNMIPLIESMGAENEETRPSFFEVSTAMAFEIFKREKVDVAVIEVGLGGRLDATNVVLPDVAVITNISYDHMHVLGNTLEKIAAEKAGIIKDGSIVVCGETSPGPMEVIRKVAIDSGSPFFLLEKDFYFSNPFLELNNNRFDYYGVNCELKDLIMKMNGVHQFRNASIALATTELFLKNIGMPFNKDQIKSGLIHAFWPGRFEIIEYKDRKILFDGAHNEAGMTALRTNLEAYLPGMKLPCVFGVVDDKNYKVMFERLKDKISTFIVTRPLNYRSTKSQEVFEFIKTNFQSTEYYEDPVEALERLLTLTEAGETILVCGSLYLVGHLRNYVLTGERGLEYDRIA